MKHQGGIVMKKMSFGWFVLFGMLLVPSLAFSSDIFEAIQNNDIKAVEAYINRGGSVNIVSTATANITPLILAVENDRLEIVKLLIDEKADVNIMDSTGNTALIMAVRNDNAELVKLLIRAKADPNLHINNQGHEFTTPLWLAVDKSSYEITKLLIKAKADVNIKQNGMSVLTLSMMKTPVHPNGNAMWSAGFFGDDYEANMKIQKLLKGAGAKE